MCSNRNTWCDIAEELRSAAPREREPSQAQNTTLITISCFLKLNLLAFGVPNCNYEVLRFLLDLEYAAFLVFVSTSMQLMSDDTPGTMDVLSNPWRNVSG